MYLWSSCTLCWNWDNTFSWIPFENLVTVTTFQEYLKFDNHNMIADHQTSQSGISYILFFLLNYHCIEICYYSVCIVQVVLQDSFLLLNILCIHICHVKTVDDTSTPIINILRMDQIIKILKGYGMPCIILLLKLNNCTNVGIDI